MDIEKIKIIKLKESPYKNEVTASDDRIMYCEIQYKRDKSSFAGMAFSLIDEKNAFTVNECKEHVIQNINKYEKMYIGCEKSYIESIREKCFCETKNYGIEIVFLVYSDVRSSQIVFEDLMEQIDKNVETIKKLFCADYF